MELTISQDAYERRVKEKQAVVNKRIRPDDVDFLDALLSTNMTATPERQKLLRQ